MATGPARGRLCRSSHEFGPTSEVPARANLLLYTVIWWLPDSVGHAKIWVSETAASPETMHICDVFGRRPVISWGGGGGVPPGRLMLVIT